MLDPDAACGLDGACGARYGVGLQAVLGVRRPRGQRVRLKRPGGRPQRGSQGRDIENRDEHADNPVQHLTAERRCENCYFVDQGVHPV
jgi:hypothetical protein